QTVRLIMFRVPESTAVGSYRLAYTVTGRNAGDPSATEELTAVVASYGRLDIIERHAPSRVIAGEILVAELTVVYHGNSEGGVVVDVTSSESYLTAAHPSHFILGPGGSRDITVVAETSRDVGRTFRHVFMVEASIPQLGGGEATAASTLVQTVIPRVSELLDPYNRVPSSLRTTYLDGRGEPSVQLELTGRGELTDEGSNEVEFMLRTPDSRDKSRFGLKDEYALRFKGDRYDVLVGDGTYQLTRLTGQRRQGRGATAALSLANVDASVSYFETRTRMPQRERGVATVSYNHGDDLSLGLNYVKTPPGDGDIVSAGLTSKNSPFVDVDLEYAAQVDRSDRRAYWARVRGTWGSARCLLEGLDSDGGFTGRLSNENHLMGTVDVPLFAGIHGHAMYRDHENRNDDFPEVADDGTPILSYTTSDATRSLGLRGKLSGSLRASVDFRRVHRQGRSSSTAFEYETDATRLELAWARNSLTATNSVEFGRLYDVIEGVESEVARLALGLKIRPSHDWHIFGRYESALSGSPDPSNRNDIARLGAEFMQNEGFSCAASARWIGIAQSIAGRPDEFIASAGYTLPWEHTLSGEVRWMRVDDVSDYERDLRVTYEMPFNAPISPRGGVGSLSGTVSDAADPDLQGVPDVVLTLDGLTAVTDSRGAYVFRSVPPGDYYLTVDPASVGSDRVPSTALPKGVSITEGQKSVLNFDIDRPGRICGKVLVNATKDDFDAGWGITGSGGPPALLVEASCGGQVRKQLTDSDGHFTFDGLRPGRWKVIVASDGLPRLYTIDRNTFLVDVGSGATDHIEVNVSAPAKIIPIIDTGDIRLSGTAD
ncbi:MAG TPA: carboxypeptidase-like regulatory domain-containing protein, partial [bacterium]|nr:carboxypeptidase-like regulatory domain-containing protein [bacterium]